MFQRFLTPKPKISLSCPKLVAPLPISLMTINIYQYPFNFLACFPTSNLIKKLYNSIYFHFSFIFKSIYIHINIYILLSLFNKWCWNSLISTCKKKNSNFNPYLALNTNIHSNWIPDTNVKSKTKTI